MMVTWLGSDLVLVISTTEFSTLLKTLANGEEGEEGDEDEGEVSGFIDDDDDEDDCTTFCCCCCCAIIECKGELGSAVVEDTIIAAVPAMLNNNIVTFLILCSKFCFHFRSINPGT